MKQPKIPDFPAIFPLARAVGPAAALARVHPVTRTPLLATLLSGGIVLTVTLLVPFERLLTLCDAITLAVGTLNSLASQVTTQASVAGYLVDNVRATYSVGGRQYVVIACGGGKMGTPSGDAYVAFALPDKSVAGK